MPGRTLMIQGTASHLGQSVPLTAFRRLTGPRSRLLWRRQHDGPRKTVPFIPRGGGRPEDVVAK